LPINHMVVVSETLSRTQPEAVREVFRLLSESAALAPTGGLQFSADEMSRSLSMISDYAAQQGLIPRAFAVDEMFDDLTRTLR
jgi:4,5-dihydroxyphthalate decarboxylase